MYIRFLTLVLTVFNSGLCFSQPIEAVNFKKYSGACLSSTKFFNPGTFTFDVKASKMEGTIFCAFLTDFEINRSEDNLKHFELGFELIGKRIDTIKCVAYLYGGKRLTKSFPLGFDASVKYHNYKIVQEDNAVKWLVDGKVFYQLDTEPSLVLLKPMRLYLNFRPAVSHCDWVYGCIRRSKLPSYAFVKNFEYCPNVNITARENFPHATFTKNHKDKFWRFNAEIWQYSTIDLIKGNKPVYLTENLVFTRKYLKMIINRDED
jgi:hypothetical protein